MDRLLELCYSLLKFGSKRGSDLCSEELFYEKFAKDLNSANGEVIISSPFITCRRVNTLLPILKALTKRKVRVIIFTRDPWEHELDMQVEADECLRELLLIGVQVILTQEYDHRKVAIIDRKILWEGSLNILSQSYSKEVMRRTKSSIESKLMFSFLNYGQYIY